jgi:hypothetical protein
LVSTPKNKTFYLERKMKTLTSLIAALALTVSVGAFADENVKSALKHANAAVEHGKMGHAPILVEHAKAALEDTLAAAITTKGQVKTHVEAASKSLQEAIDHGTLGHADMATKPAEEAVEHLKAANK